MIVSNSETAFNAVLLPVCELIQDGGEVRHHEMRSHLTANRFCLIICDVLQSHGSLSLIVFFVIRGLVSVEGNVLRRGVINVASIGALNLIAQVLLVGVSHSILF